MRRRPVQNPPIIGRNLLILLALIGLISLLSGCGGGGGGDGFIGAAQVSISATPNRIDTGDRTQLRISISEVHENGIALKIHHPDGLTYVRDSATLIVEGADIDTGPLNNVSSETGVFLVFYFTQSIFGKNDRGELLLELEATGEVSDGSIEVDADVDDPLIDNENEFSVETPEFQGEVSASIEVID